MARAQKPLTNHSQQRHRSTTYQCFRMTCIQRQRHLFVNSLPQSPYSKPQSAKDKNKPSRIKSVPQTSTSHVSEVIRRCRTHRITTRTQARTNCTKKTTPRTLLRGTNKAHCSVATATGTAVRPRPGQQCSRLTRPQRKSHGGVLYRASPTVSHQLQHSTTTDNNLSVDTG